MLYRGDLFEDPILNPNDLPPPTTLEEWATLSELFHGQDLNGDGIPDYGTCIDATADRKHFQAGMWAILAQTQTSMANGIFFHPTTFEPL